LFIYVLNILISEHGHDIAFLIRTHSIVIDRDELNKERHLVKVSRFWFCKGSSVSISNLNIHFTQIGSGAADVRLCPNITVADRRFRSVL
jgi:hypothetical protein